MAKIDVECPITVKERGLRRTGHLKRIIAHVFGHRSKKNFANYWGCCQVSMSPFDALITSVFMAFRMKNTSKASFTHSGLSVSIARCNDNHYIEYMTQ
jgi:insertion element IS1 protein InsB